jgi:FAD/FMN-containing dehydrogenase
MGRLIPERIGTVNPTDQMNEIGLPDVIDALTVIVGRANILLGDDARPYAVGARYGDGLALCVVRPALAQEVCEVVRLCVERGIPLVVQGANTGLVGAGTPDASGAQVVLSLSRLRRECVVDADNRSVTVDAGVTLQEVNDKLEPHGLWFPIDLGANPSIGGMVAANTGGTRLIRYGDVRHNLLALDVVLFNPPGELAHFGSALRKDNTGSDLKQLFVGTSGVYGVITRATLEVHPRPRQSATALVVPQDEASVMTLLRALESELGEFLSAFEGMSTLAMQAAIDHIPALYNPFAPEALPEFAILIELESSVSSTYAALNLQDMLTRFLEDQFGTTISNAVIGNGTELWHLRHGISEGARSMGRIIAFDVSVPRARIMEFRRTANALVAAQFAYLQVVDFGHIADGGVHFNVIWPHDAAQAYDIDTVTDLRDRIYALVAGPFNGSFSAEHGVGPHNLRYYRQYASDISQTLCAGIKQLVDPLGLCGTVDFGPQHERADVSS